MFTKVIYGVSTVVKCSEFLHMDYMLCCSTTPCLKKLCKLIFCQNFVKFRPILKIFGTKIAAKTSFSAVYSFSTSPNLCQCTTVLNVDVPNCYITQCSVGESLPLQNSWRWWTQNTSDRWLSAVWPVDRWCRYQPVASSSKRFCLCRRGTLRAQILTILNGTVIQTNNSAK